MKDRNQYLIFFVSRQLLRKDNIEDTVVRWVWPGIPNCTQTCLGLSWVNLDDLGVVWAHER